MPSAAQTQLLEKKLVSIRVPQAEIAIILKNFETLSNDIKGGSLARQTQVIQKVDPLEAVAQKIIDDPVFRDKFIENYVGAVKILGYYTPDQK